MTSPLPFDSTPGLTARAEAIALLEPRPHQRKATAAILAARAAGRPGFLLGDMTGLGKTLAVWCAIAAMPEREVLIVCPKGAIPQWRRTIALAGCPEKAVTLINYERTKSLMAAPAESQRRSTRAKNNELAKHGLPKKTWPIVVFDESHRLRNPYAQQSLVGQQLAGAADFSIYMSATAGQTPHELSYLGALLGHAAGSSVETLADFRELMKRLKIGRAKGRWTNWSWEANARDRAVMADLLFKGARAIGMRRRPNEIAGWPEVARELAPTALSSDERRLYDETWRQFRREVGLLGGSTRRPTGWAAELRFRQKASLLRVAGTADFAQDLLETDHQVAISVAFLETSSALAAKLAGRGWRVGEINGERDAMRTRRRGSLSRPGSSTKSSSRSRYRSRSIAMKCRAANGSARSSSTTRGTARSSWRRSGPVSSRRRGGDDLCRLCRGHGRGSDSGHSDAPDGLDGSDGWRRRVHARRIAEVIEDARLKGR